MAAHPAAQGLRIAIAIAITINGGQCALTGWFAPSGIAFADHDMAMMSDHHGESTEVSLGVTLEAAEFDTLYYAGSYQGVAPSIGWMRGPLGASATIGLYHLTENGLSRYGIGDAMVTGHVAVIATDRVEAGIALHVMWPTGSEPDGLGMGHVMAMPSVWGTWHSEPVTLHASAGYGRALTLLGGHDHGPMPLVDPMNPQELTFRAGGDIEVGRGVRLGARAIGALPIGAGVTRMIGAGRVAWGTARVSTALELQVGVAGDPFTIRGVVDTALRF